ncbi:hypothetical protein [Fimbriiglobus ruber]|uniref:Uncharacterized protein n=1 Tax=Fimbriiglobus ruber TaxID=1908690 RepID=A0A225D020_9BACT|nr:hypothetical protein [Fimbriiglobus ruber]OWK34283.1 hypothetical protein FRUB_10254 [Fimbriiglobus ruber]
MIARLPGPAEAAYHATAIKTVEQTVPTLNDFLGKMVTLNAALLGGGFLVAKGDVLPIWWGILVMISLLISLSVALWGLMPERSNVNLDARGGLEAYREFDNKLIAKKDCAIQGSAAAIIAAFAIGVVGLAVKAWPSETTATQTTAERVKADGHPTGK